MFPGKEAHKRANLPFGPVTMSWHTITRRYKSGPLNFPENMFGILKEFKIICFCFIPNQGAKSNLSSIPDIKKSEEANL